VKAASFITSPLEDPYTILQIPRSASQQQIKEAYRAQLRLHRPGQYARGSETRTRAEAQTERIEAAYAQLRESDRTAASVRPQRDRPPFALSLPHTTLIFIGFLVLAAVAIALMAAWLRPESDSVVLNPQAIPIRQFQIDPHVLQSGDNPTPPGSAPSDRILPSAPAFVDAQPTAEPLPMEVAQQVGFEFDNPGDAVVKGTLTNHTEWSITEVQVEFSRQYFDGDFVADSDQPVVNLRLEQQPVDPGAQSRFAYDLRDYLVPIDIAGEPILPAMNPIEVIIKGIEP